jgi:hypothetical protein
MRQSFSVKKDIYLKKLALFNLMMLCTLLVTSGAACPRRFWKPFQSSPPVVFSSQPTLQEITEVINANRARITGLYSTNSRISGSGFPSLRTSLAVGSERHVRLRAGTGVTGQEMDVGSNQEVFWVWIKRADPPALYYGRYDQFPSDATRQILPVRPEWLVEAIGIVSLAPNGPHQGPFRRNDGLLEVHTPIATLDGQFTRVLVIDAGSGWIREQQLLNANRQVIARATNSQHFRDPGTGAVLPRHTEIDWPGAGMQLSLELGNTQIGPLDPQSEMWTKPDYPGFPDVLVTQPPPPVVLPDPAAAAPRKSDNLAGSLAEIQGWRGERAATIAEMSGTQIPVDRAAQTVPATTVRAQNGSGLQTR